MTSPVDILETENLKKKEETNEPGKDIATVIICRIKPLGSVFEPVPPSHEAESSNNKKNPPRGVHCARKQVPNIWRPRIRCKNLAQVFFNQFLVASTKCSAKKTWYEDEYEFSKKPVGGAVNRVFSDLLRFWTEVTKDVPWLLKPPPPLLFRLFRFVTWSRLLKLVRLKS